MKLLEEAVMIAYTCRRLDSARFMAEAHQFYRPVRFMENEPDDGTEIPKEFHSHWLFMEKQL
jgi:hypothetical protein